MSEIESRIACLVSPDARVTVGRFTYGSPKFELWEQDEHVEIGAFCSIADHVVIFGGGEHRTDWVTTFPLRIAFGQQQAGKDGHPATKGHTRIGSDVWIGYGATILSGVSIGDGAVIGARAVVTKNVEPYSIVAGNPAQRVRMRFSEHQVASLLKIRWWEWPLDKIFDEQAALCGGDIDEFIGAYI